jgi:hypothetical protein
VHLIAEDKKPLPFTIIKGVQEFRLWAPKAERGK